MAKGLGKTAKKRVRKGAKTAEKKIKKGMKKAQKNIEKLKPRDRAAAAKVAGVAAVGVAGVAGIVAAVQHLRKGRGGRATLHVRTEGDHWVIIAEGGDDALEAYRTKEEALAAARHAAAQAAPSELVIHRLDGSVMAKHSYDGA